MLVTKKESDSNSQYCFLDYTSSCQNSIRIRGLILSRYKTVHGFRAFERYSGPVVHFARVSPELEEEYRSPPPSFHLPPAIYIRSAETRPSFAFLRTRGSASLPTAFPRTQKSRRGGRRRTEKVSFLPSFHRWPAQSERDRSAISRGRGQISPDNNTSLLQQFQQLRGRGRAQLQVYVRLTCIR